MLDNLWDAVESLWKEQPDIPRAGGKPAEVVVLNGRVFTVDDKQPWAQAVAIQDARLVYVGDRAGVADFVGPKTLVIDAHDQLVTPGFVDNHCHVIWIAALLGVMTKELYEAQSLEDVTRIMRRHAAAHAELPFVLGVGWRYEYIPGEMPNRELGDAILSDRPLFLMSFDGETGWVNSRALELMQTRNAAAMEDLVPVRDPQRSALTGAFLHFYAFDPFNFFPDSEITPGVREKMYAGITDGLRQGLRAGVTSFHDVQLYKSFLPMLLEFHARGGLENVRVRGAFYIGHSALAHQAGLQADLRAWRELGARVNDAHLILGDSVKLYIDGVFANQTAFVMEPYSNKPDSYGVPVWTQEGFNRVVEIVDALEMQVCTHAIGDAGIHRVVNAYEHAQKINGGVTRRHRIEHCMLSLAEDIKRMAALGIHAAMQPTHLFGSVCTEAALGPERLQRLVPWQTLGRAGVDISFGSDWCAGPINPIYGLLIAALRLNYKQADDWGPAEKIDLATAIRYYTLGAARALWMEQDIGSLEVGKYGDLVLWDTNLLEIDQLPFLLTNELELGKLDHFVNLTMVGGTIVYRKGET